jgi:hypothetical protein
MTEDEARKKWCPFVRMDNGYYNRSAQTNHHKCLASECAAWRWVPDPLISFVSDGQTIVNKSTDHGYCGLAGKP